MAPFFLCSSALQGSFQGKALGTYCLKALPSSVTLFSDQMISMLSIDRRIQERNQQISVGFV